MSGSYPWRLWGHWWSVWMFFHSVLHSGGRRTPTARGGGVFRIGAPTPPSPDHTQLLSIRQCLVIEGETDLRAQHGRRGQALLPFLYVQLITSKVKTNTCTMVVHIRGLMFCPLWGLWPGPGPRGVDKLSPGMRPFSTTPLWGWGYLHCMSAQHVFFRLTYRNTYIHICYMFLFQSIPTSSNRGLQSLSPLFALKYR